MEYAGLTLPNVNHPSSKDLKDTEVRSQNLSEHENNISKPTHFYISQQTLLTSKNGRDHQLPQIFVEPFLKKQEGCQEDQHYQQ